MLSWRLSNTMDTAFCLDALHEAIDRYGTPEIFNSDQCSQFTSEEFTGCLISDGIKISKDGKGRWVDNVIIERAWKSVKYEIVVLELKVKHGFTFQWADSAKETGVKQGCSPNASW